MPKKKTTAEFIEQCHEVHGDRYDYSKVNYEHSEKKVSIICSIHGEFKQTPNEHYNKKRGCTKCGRIVCANKLSLTMDEWIKKARQIHGDKFDYSKVKYIDGHKKVIIICPIHGEFKQHAASHIQGHQCKPCGIEVMRKSIALTQEEWIKKARQIHGDKFDYSKVKYIDGKKKVIIICPIHGEFEQRADGHINCRGAGCNACGFISASVKQSLTTDEWIQKARVVWGDKFNYSKVEYKNSNVKVTIICPFHGEFQQNAGNHLKGHDCKACTNKGYSQVAIQWLKWRMIKDNCFIRHAENGGEIKIGPYWVDGFCEETQTVYEYDGDPWHGNPKLFNPQDINPISLIPYGKLYENTIKKKEYLINCGFHFIQIWGSMWKYKIKCIKIIQRWWRKNK